MYLPSTIEEVVEEKVGDNISWDYINAIYGKNDYVKQCVENGGGVYVDATQEYDIADAVCTTDLSIDRIQSPKITLSYMHGENEVKLNEGIDYTIQYAVEGTKGIATVTGMGCYTGTKEIPYSLYKDLEACSFELAEENFVWTGAAIEPRTTVKDGEEILTEGTDYRVTYADNIEPGMATVTITGIGDYRGSLSKNFYIVTKNPGEDSGIIDNSGGDNSGGTTEEPGGDNTGGTTEITTEVTTENSTEKPTEVSTEEPTEKPTEVSTEEPTEKPTEVSTEEPTEKPTEVSTEESTEKPTEASTEEPTEKPTEVSTEEPTEKPTEVSTEEPTEKPTEVSTEEPTEKPTEVSTEEPTEKPTEVSTEEPTEKPTEKPTEVSTEEPTEKPTEVSTEEPTEKPTEVSTEVTTEKPTEVSTEVTIEKPTEQENTTTRISLEHVVITPLADVTFCGRAWEPKPVLSYQNEVLLIDRDYHITYQNNVNAGTAIIRIDGLGRYMGQRSISFTIQPFDVSGLSDVLKGKDGKIYAAAYTEKKIQPTTAFRLKAEYRGETVYLLPKEGQDYTCEYRNNKKVGEANIVYTFGGNYRGIVVKRFYIVPDSPTIKQVNRKKAGQYIVWKKVKLCDSYEVYRKQGSANTYKKIARVKGKCSYLDRKAPKKTCYYCVVACKRQGKQVYRSAFSKAHKSK